MGNVEISPPSGLAASALPGLQMARALANAKAALHDGCTDLMQDLFLSCAPSIGASVRMHRVCVYVFIYKRYVHEQKCLCIYIYMYMYFHNIMNICV